MPGKIDPTGIKKRPSVERPGEALKHWAFVPFVEFRAKNGKQYSSALEFLAELAIEERWFFGAQPNPRNAYPILDSYLTYTFFKLKQEKRVLEFKAGRVGWATFNTGLVDRLYDPIYALFAHNDRPQPAWKFSDFCVPGKGASGKKLTEIFDPLPEPTTYFSSNFDMLLDTTKDIHVDYEHVIRDGVSRDRFPPEFLAHHVPKGFKLQDYTRLGRAERGTYLAALSDAIAQDLQCTRAIKNRLEDAKALGEKRTRWNFKTAIPQYYPTHNIMSLLPPWRWSAMKRSTSRSWSRATPLARIRAERCFLWSGPIKTPDWCVAPTAIGSRLTESNRSRKGCRMTTYRRRPSRHQLRNPGRSLDKAKGGQPALESPRRRRYSKYALAVSCLSHPHQEPARNSCSVFAAKGGASTGTTIFCRRKRCGPWARRDPRAARSGFHP